ncbi:MAG TPA: FAD-binding protein, partial [Feifaniaceae bacterium]|nr:FAD-binding protein [Feifaniaceae bacterium]
TNVLSIEGFNEGRLCCRRLTEEGAHALRLALPVLVSVCGGQNFPRPPSLAGLRRAREAALEVFTNRELGLPPEHVGLRGSPTRVRAVRKAELSKRRCRRYPDIQAGMEDVLAAIAAASSPACQIAPQDSSDIAGTYVVWVFVWEEDPLSAAAAGELFAEVRRMGAVPIAFVAGSLPFAESIATMGAESILLVEFDMTPSERDCAHALAELASMRRPGAILFPATICGRSVAPQCAALLETGLTADCTGLKLTDGGLLIQTRPAFGGALLAEIVCEHARPQLASVRPGAFLPLCGGMRPAPVERMQRIAQDTCCSKEDTLSYGTAPFCDAQIVVAGGKGVGSRAEFALLRRLAELVGGEVGASRAAVDAGYAAYERQVGQTGVMLRPRLYIAFGISGAIQHIVGMQQGECIIAVNSDPKAPIFDYADIAVISPWKDAAHALIKELERRQAQSCT